MVKKEVISCPIKMVQAPTLPGPPKGGAAATPARVEKAAVGESEKDKVAIVAAVRVEVLAVAGTQEAASLYPRHPDGQS
jgi:hypothetical protein